MAKASFKVTGMKCGGCEKTVRSIADELDGVLSCMANVKEGLVEVEYDEGTIGLADIQKAIVAKGFPLA
jgi:copper chaperone